MLRPAPFFFLPNTTTLLARTAINLLKGTNQDLLDEAIQTLVNRRLNADAVMSYLEQNVHVAEVLEKLAKDWVPETVRVFANALQMDPAKTDVMDLIVAIAILNEPDLETELRSENVTDATASDLLQNRRITWQYPSPGTPLAPPYVILVAVEQVDTSAADSEVQAILGELAEYKGYKIARRTPNGSGRIPLGPIRIRPEVIAALANRVEPAVQPTAPAATAAGPSGVLPGLMASPGMSGTPATSGAAPSFLGNILPATPAAPAAVAPPPATSPAATGVDLSSLLMRSTRLGVL